MTNVPLSVGLPATAAALAYLDARYFVSYDLGFLWQIVRAEISQKKIERTGRHNMFYMFEEQATNPATADKACLYFQGREWSYRVAYETILRYGQWLKDKFQIQPGEVIALDCMNKPNFIFIWFGLWHLGAKVAFINYNLTDKPLLHSVKMATSRLILVDSDVKDAFTESVMSEFASPTFRNGEVRDNNVGPTQVTFFTDDLEQQIWRSYKPVREPDTLRDCVGTDMCFLIYTSGTTGLPKPAYLHWNKMNRVRIFVPGYLKLRPTDRFFTAMPLYHSAGSVLACLNSFSMGITLVLGYKFSNKTFWPTVRDSKATVIQYVGETCRYLLAAPPSPLDGQNDVRLAFGNGLRPDIWNTFKTRFNIQEIVEFYGATEGPMSTWNRSRNDFTMGVMGRTGKLLRLLFGGRTVLVEHDHNTEEPVRDPNTGFCVRIDTSKAEPGSSTAPPGELLYRLPDVLEEQEEAFAGYYGNKKATSSKIVRDVFIKGDAYFRSGDLARVDPDGHSFFHDRIGDTFRWKSENVSTNEVADAIGSLELDAIEEANVYGVEIPGYDGRAGCAALVLKEVEDEQGNTKPSQKIVDDVLKEMATRLPQKLPSYAVPIFVRLTTPAERTGTNKQQKSVLRAEGVQPDKIETKGDLMYWLQKQGGTNDDNNNNATFVYTRYGQKEYDELKGGRVRL